MRDLLRRGATAVALAALLGSAVYGADLFGLRDAVTGDDLPEARPPATGASVDTAPSPTASPTATRVRSHPWWQTIARTDGTGDGDVAATIQDHAIQWRIRWSCTGEHIVISRDDDRDPVVDAACPDGEPGYATSVGPVDLTVRTAGSWELTVEQQVDVPLVEPPLESMQAGGTAVRTGSFYDIDQTGRGTVTLHRLPDGSHALRLEEFFVTPDVDLEVRLSTVAEPRTTADYLDGESVLVGGLEATTGSMNFRVPAGIDPSAYRSVVIWCPPVLSAYAAASLQPVGEGGDA